jgi:hypothetical protein
VDASAGLALDGEVRPVRPRLHALTPSRPHALTPSLDTNNPPNPRLCRPGQVLLASGRRDRAGKRKDTPFQVRSRLRLLSSPPETESGGVACAGWAQGEAAGVVCGEGRGARGGKRLTRTIALAQLTYFRSQRHHAYQTCMHDLFFLNFLCVFFAPSPGTPPFRELNMNIKQPEQPRG